MTAPMTAKPVSTAKPPPNYARLTYWSLNLILLVLVPILILLGISAVRDAKADYSEREHAEYCQFFVDNDFPTPADC